MHGVHRILQAEDYQEKQLDSVGNSRIAARARRSIDAAVAAHVSGFGGRVFAYGWKKEGGFGGTINIVKCSVSRLSFAHI